MWSMRGSMGIAMSKIFSAPAILTRVAYLKDHGVSLGFSTQELSIQDKVIVSEFYQSSGYLLFKENEIKHEDIPQGDAPDETKSPSQRLRGALFVLWKQQGSIGDFETFYRVQMDRAINRVKRLLLD